MSQSVEIAVVVEGVSSLLEALAEAGAEWSEQRRMKDAEGREHEVDYVARDAAGAEVGVRVDPRTKRATLVARDCEAGGGKALAGRIVQAYARSRVVAELERKGYRLAKEERRADGSVRLVLSRWR
jgi:hypothetical protein